MPVNKVAIRRLNYSGLREFTKSIDKKQLPDEGLIENDAYTEVITDISTKIDKAKEFKDRHQLAEYVHQIIHPSIQAKPSLEKDWGMWGWIALPYINQLTLEGEYINKNEHYIPKEKGERSSLLYRHCIYGPYKSYVKFGDEMKIFLSSRGIHALGDCWEQMMSNNLLSEYPELFEVFKDCYFNPQTGGVIDGSNRYPEKDDNGDWDMDSNGVYVGFGKIRRYKRVISQLQVTQRIESISKRQIQNLLPVDEFS